jgi:hypothetical protein
MLGIILKDFRESQINYEIFSQGASTENFFGIIRNSTESFMNVRFPVVNYSKIYSGYMNEDYTLVATDLDSALCLANVKNKAKKIFYVWELEFLKMKSFSTNVKIYRSLDVYTRSESYKKALDNYANINAKVLDFKLEKLCQI